MAWWLSWLERRPVTAEVVGSNPIRVAETEKFQNNLINGILAQLGEHLPYKQRVIGSSPIGPIMDGFPSGQRGQTVNLLQIASVVRIHLHPSDKGSNESKLSEMIAKRFESTSIHRIKVVTNRNCLK